MSLIPLCNYNTVMNLSSYSQACRPELKYYHINLTRIERGVNYMREVPTGLYNVLPANRLVMAERIRAKKAHEDDVDTADRLNLRGNRRQAFFRDRHLEEAGRMLRLQAKIAERGF